RSERFFTDHGEISTFLARMVPVVRHLISLPAGLARMNLGKFVTFTGLGALVWCTILTWIGWFIGRKEDVIITVLNEEARSYAGRAVLILLPVLALVAAAYVWWRRRRVAQRGSAGEGGRTDPCPRRGSSFTAGCRVWGSDGSSGRRQTGSGCEAGPKTCPTAPSKCWLKAPIRRSGSSSSHSGEVRQWRRSRVWNNTMFHMMWRCQNASKSTD